jgi:tetratricopeptide (TPR) repeat protein
LEEASSTTFEEAIAAAKRGERTKARELLIRLIRSDPENAEYWVWLSSVADAKKDKIACLEKALELEPANPAAQRGLVILGAREPRASEVEAAAKASRKLAEEMEPPSRIQEMLRKNWLLIGAGSAIPLLILLTFVVFAARPSAPAPTLPPPSPTVTDTPVVPTNTPAPVEVLIVRTPIPMEYGATPLSAFVPQTSTPTPALGFAERSPYEAYTSAVKAFFAGDYEQTLDLVAQVLKLDPTSAEAHYLRGEAWRMLSSPKKALREYDQVIEQAPDFAPAFLGRARVRLIIDSDDLPEDYDLAIEADPRLIPAYVEKAAFQAAKRDWSAAEDTLRQALENGLTSPIVYVRLSGALRNQGQYSEALEAAKIGSGNDPGMVPGYLALGSAYVELGQFENALWPLQTYAVYAADDPLAWLYLGRAHFGIGEEELGIQLLTQALEKDPSLTEAYYFRALYHSQTDQHALAIEDFQRARDSGRDDFTVNMGIAESQYVLGEYEGALENVERAMEHATQSEEAAEALVLKAMIFENQEPISLEEAIETWKKVQDIENLDSETRSLAQSHLKLLRDLLPTPTPTPTPLAAVGKNDWREWA